MQPFTGVDGAIVLELTAGTLAAGAFGTPLVLFCDGTTAGLTSTCASAPATKITNKTKLEHHTTLQTKST